MADPRSADLPPPAAADRRTLLLDAVLADPDSDAARQVYADALLAANDPRGELILVDRALAGRLSIYRRDALARRKAELLARHGASWFPYRVKTRLSRGFIAAIAGTLPRLAAEAAPAFAAEPITEVEVSGVRGPRAVDELLAASWLPRVHKLIVRGELGGAGFAALVGSPRLANLRELNVTGNAIPGEALAALRDHLPRCRMLVLSNNPLADGVAGLAAWPHAGGLETLYLGRCRLTAGGVEQLLADRAWPKLTKLALTRNQLGGAGAAAIASHARHLPALRHLELRWTGLHPGGVERILAALPALRRLDVRDNTLDHRMPARDPRVVV